MALGTAALVVALIEVRLIFWFVLFARSGIATAFTPVVLCSLFWKGTTRAGAVAGMLTGFLTAMGWGLWLKPLLWDLYEMIPGFLAGLAATVLVSLVTEPPEGGAEELASVYGRVGRVLRAHAE